MIVWRGLGILVAVVAGGALVLTQLVFDAALGQDAYSRNSGWLAPLALLLAAAVIWPLGTYLNNRGARVYIDKATGREVVMRPNHSLFFVRMEYWAPILAVIAVVAAAYNAIR
jgi:hypothetical protein